MGRGAAPQSRVGVESPRTVAGPERSEGESRRRRGEGEVGGGEEGERLAAGGASDRITIPIDDLLRMNARELSRYLLRTDVLGDRFRSFASKFDSQGIDGQVFLDLDLPLLGMIAPDSLIGDRLHLMKMVAEAGRKARIAHRNRILLQGAVVVTGRKAKFELTNSALNIVYLSASKTSSVKEQETYLQKTRAKEVDHQTVKTHNEYNDYIDLLTVEDVDFDTHKEDMDVQRTTSANPSCCMAIFYCCCPCCCSPPPVQQESKSVQLKEEMNVYISLNTSEHSREAPSEAPGLNLVLTFDSIKRGKVFYRTLDKINHKMAVAGSKTIKALPQGTNDIQLYSWGTPNGHKVRIMLEELQVPYDFHGIAIGQNDQFTSGFVEVSPNSKIPAIVDLNAEGAKGPLRVFESGSILLYLAHKYGKLIAPPGTAAHAEAISWAFWQVGSLGPNMGQLGHFGRREDSEYAKQRFQTEVLRLLDVLEGHLAQRAKDGKEFLAGDEYSIADIMCWPWVYGAIKMGALEKFRAAVERADAWATTVTWAEQCAARPASQRALNLAKDQTSCFGEDKGTPVPAQK